MFFDNNLLSIRQNGRFAKCWLAATNPKAFRSYVKKIDLEKIQISNVCEEIIDTLMKNKRNPKKRLTLYLAAQLVFGTVCIYQQQVLFLYEKTNNLLFDNTTYFESTSTLFNKKRNLPLEKTCAKRRKLMNNKNLTEAEKFLCPNVIEEIQKEVIPVQVVPAIEAVRGSYLINDISWTMPEPPEPELFGEMSQNELQDFLDIFEGRKSMAHICPEQIEDTSHKPSEYDASEKDEMDIPIKTLQDIARNKRNKGQKTPYSKPLENQQDEEGRVALPVPNEEIQQCNNEEITANTTQINTTNNIIEIEHNHLGITICQDIQISPPQLDRNCDISTIQEMDITTTETPKQAAKRKLDEIDINLENLPKALINSMFTQRKRKKQSKLKIDNNISIVANILIKQIECTENILRCLDPRDDIVPSHMIKTKTADKMFLTSCRKMPSISMNTRFGNNLKIKGVKKDSNILKKILDQPIDENEDQNLVTNCEQINLINDSRTEVAQQNVPQNIDLAIEASRIIENEDDIALPLNLKNDLLLNFAKENQQKDINQEVTDVNFNITETNIKNCDREAIVRKLLYFWKKDTHPINMKTLCNKANRKYAARTFSSIIELSAYKYINIIKYNDNIEIYHIEMGERIVQNLNEKL